MKGRVFLFSILVFVFLAYFITAQEIECDAGDESCKIDKARSCLEEKIEDRGCEQLSSEERVFSLLAAGECKSEVKDDSKFQSDVKFTAQAILALENSGSGISNEKEWLMSDNKTSTGLIWFLEIESSKATECTVDYSSSNRVNFGADKKISFLSGGNCLSPYQEGYWLEISSDCYDEEFTISCDESFLTTTLYQKQGSDTIFVSASTHSASADGITEEKVESLCFEKGGSCDYEATLWGALVLSFLGENIVPYLPFLVVMEEDNNDLFPEAFLYYATGNLDFRNKLLSKQISNKWWISLNDKYYGTALALFSLQFENPQQKTDSVNWLFNEAQNQDGCWDSGNIRNTAFILYSLSPKSFSGGSGGGGGSVSCENSGYSCTSQINCAAGNILSGYSCSGAFVCCSEEISLTCSEKGGEICSSSQNCVGVGSFVDEASNLGLGQLCCVNGFCEEPQVTSSACESSGGVCRVSGCLENEEKTFAVCDFSSDFCCIQKSKEETTSYLYVWILGILIILVTLAIIFRDKLRPYWIRIKSEFKGFGRPSETKKKPGFPPLFPPSEQSILRRPSPRRMMSSSPPRKFHKRIIPKTGPKGEIDEVLKKLKDMSK